jgi:hypothetical protein
MNRHHRLRHGHVQMARSIRQQARSDIPRIITIEVVVVRIPGAADLYSQPEKSLMIDIGPRIPQFAPFWLEVRR